MDFSIKTKKLKCHTVKTKEWDCYTLSTCNHWTLTLLTPFNSNTRISCHYIYLLHFTNIVHIICTKYCCKTQKVDKHKLIWNWKSVNGLVITSSEPGSFARCWTQGWQGQSWSHWSSQCALQTPWSSPQLHRKPQSDSCTWSGGNSIYNCYCWQRSLPGKSPLKASPLIVDHHAGLLFLLLLPLHVVVHLHLHHDLVRSVAPI